MIMAKKHNIVKPPFYIFLIHTLFASLSAAIILFFKVDSLYIYGYILALFAFSSGLIFLAIDRNLQSSKNYSLHWTSHVTVIKESPYWVLLIPLGEIVFKFSFIFITGGGSMYTLMSLFSFPGSVTDILILIVFVPTPILCS